MHDHGRYAVCRTQVEERLPHQRFAHYHGAQHEEIAVAVVVDVASSGQVPAEPLVYSPRHINKLRLGIETVKCPKIKVGRAAPAAGSIGIRGTDHDVGSAVVIHVARCHVPAEPAAYIATQQRLLRQCRKALSYYHFTDDAVLLAQEEIDRAAAAVTARTHNHIVKIVAVDISERRQCRAKARSSFGAEVGPIRIGARPPGRTQVKLGPSGAGQDNGTAGRVRNNRVSSRYSDNDIVEAVVVNVAGGNCGKAEQSRSGNIDRAPDRPCKPLRRTGKESYPSLDVDGFVGNHFIGADDRARYLHNLVGRNQENIVITVVVHVTGRSYRKITGQRHWRLLVSCENLINDHYGGFVYAVG